MAIEHKLAVQLALHLPLLASGYRVGVPRHHARNRWSLRIDGQRHRGYRRAGDWGRRLRNAGLSLSRVCLSSPAKNTILRGDPEAPLRQRFQKMESEQTVASLN